MATLHRSGVGLRLTLHQVSLILRDVSIHTSIERTVQSTPLSRLPQVLVDAPFATEHVIDYEIAAIVLTVENSTDQTIDRIALSQTPSAAGAVKASAVPFKKIRIPLQCTENALVASVSQDITIVTSDWYNLFRPTLSARQARDNQAGAGVQCSVVVPFTGKTMRGALIFSLLCTEAELTAQHRAFFSDYATFVGKSV